MLDGSKNDCHVVIMEIYLLNMIVVLFTSLWNYWLNYFAIIGWKMN